MFLKLQLINVKKKYFSSLLFFFNYLDGAFKKMKIHYKNKATVLVKTLCLKLDD